MFNDHNEHMHACLGTHGVFKETKEVFFFFFTIIIIILLYTIFLEFYASFTFDFHISSVCRCFNIFLPHLPINEAGRLQILYHIHTVLEEPWMKHILLQGRCPDSAQLAVCPQRDEILRTFSCVHMRRKREKKIKKSVEDLNRPQLA